MSLLSTERKGSWEQVKAKRGSYIASPRSWTVSEGVLSELARATELTGHAGLDTHRLQRQTGL